MAVGGTRYPVKDGIVEVDGWDAKFLLPMGFEVDVGQRTGRASQEGRHPLDEIRAESERLIEYLAQRGGPLPPDRVRLWAPQPFGQVHGWSGKAYDVRDHWVEVGRNDAAPLLRGGFKLEA